jgi:DNA-binding response OmpR family regulator
MAPRILVVGTPADSTRAILKRLAARGWRWRAAGTLREARKLLKTSHFDIVLASEALSDGRGYELGAIVGGQLGTLFVAVALSESSLWLPVVEKGTQVLGTRGFGPSMLLREMGTILEAHAEGDARAFAAVSGVALRWRTDDLRVPLDQGDGPRGG